MLNVKSCPQCGYFELEKLDFADSQVDGLPTSDGQLIKLGTAEKYYCGHCHLFFVEYNPSDMMEVFYRHDYQVNLQTQDHPVIASGQVLQRSDMFRMQLDSVFKKVTVSKVLEVGCGVGQQINYFKSVFPTCEVYGVDPSPDIGKVIDLSYGNVFLIQKNFDKNIELPTEYFDFVVAHGIFNRIPPLSSLEIINSHCQMGAYLSIAVANLEKSLFFPFIWDHSYNFTIPTFKNYLNLCGFEILQEHDFVNNTYLLAQKKRESEKSSRQFCDNRDGRGLYNEFKRYCQEVFRVVGDLDLKTNVSLAGAGVYSGLIANYDRSKKICFVLDDVKRGNDFQHMKVIGFGQAEEYGVEEVLLFCRPEYRSQFEKQCKEYGLKINTILMDI